MKQFFLAILLAASMALSLTACGSGTAAITAAAAAETEAAESGNRYLTFTAETAGSAVSLSWDSGSDVMYSTDGGSTWTGYGEGTTITLANVGDRVSFRGKNIKTNDCEHFEMSGSIAASGDVTSLTNGIGGDATLAEGCYGCMFEGCSSLMSAPELPTTTLADECYKDMFSGCSALRTS